MEIETIEIKTSKDKFFLQYLTLKRPVINTILTKINKEPTVLTDIPMQVLAELLWLHDKFINNTEDEKWSLVFSSESKEYIMEKMNMKEHHLNVYFSQLRRIKVLNGKKINKPFMVNAVDHDLSFKFVLNGHDGK